MATDAVHIPQHIWNQLSDQTRRGSSSLAVDILLQTGREVRSLVVDEKGRFVGRLVNENDTEKRETMIVENVDFESEEIVAVRIAEGILAWFHLRRWKS